MLLFAGLGNPGAKYAGNRHNVGFMAVEAIARRHGFGPFRSRFSGQAAEGELAGEKVLVLEPLTYMNESGRAVASAMRFHKLKAAQVFTFHDELDLAPGKIRVRRGGGIAGHNGLRSLRSHIGPDFNRIRIGIGHPGDKAQVHNYVLRDFAKADNAWLAPLLDAIAEHAPLLALGKDGDFMSKVAQQTGPRPSAKPASNDPPPPAPPPPPRDDPAPRPGSPAFVEALRALKARMSGKKH
ncbi:MAG: aminoacyl-tRNA hydrolase [Acetobacterales bacterium]